MEHNGANALTVIMKIVEGDILEFILLQLQVAIQTEYTSSIYLLKKVLKWNADLN